MKTKLETKERSPFLLGTRFNDFSPNTYESIGYYQNTNPTKRSVIDAIHNAPVLYDASLQIYLHVPFCYNKCRFCAFTGYNNAVIKSIEKYCDLLIWQLKDMLNQTNIKGKHIESVHIGGGSPDLLGRHVSKVLKDVRDLPGCDDDTEISVEMSLNTTRPEFIEELARYRVTKVSLGIQTLDPQIRIFMRQPSITSHLSKVLGMLRGRIPIVNVDLLSGLPGQTLNGFLSDLRKLMDHNYINSISAYLLAVCASPSLVKGLISGEFPKLPSPYVQSLMRLYFYETLLQEGWIKGGTETYINPKKVPENVIGMLSGNEVHGQNSYSAFLIGAGPRAMSFMPGIHLENIGVFDEWSSITEKGEQPFYLPKCSVKELKDIALWIFPLRFEGLPMHRYAWMVENNALSDEQIVKLQDLINEGLVNKTSNGYQLSILGEVFRGHLVRELKKDIGRKAADDFVVEGLELGKAIASGQLKDEGSINNRQLIGKFLHRVE